MVVKIPVLVNRAKAAVSDETIETPGTNTTEITPEKKNEMAAVAAENKATTATNNTFTYHELIQRHFPRHQSKSNTNDDSNIGDNSSISSRSSMNSMPNSLDRGEANPTSYVAALKAAAAASTRPSSEDAATVSSPSDHSREHIDHSYASPESLQLDDVSVAYALWLFTLYIPCLLLLILFRFPYLNNRSRSRSRIKILTPQGLSVSYYLQDPPLRTTA